MKRISILGTFFACALAAGAARASHDYPRQIHDKFALGYTPECTMCHATNACGSGTVVTDFGLSIVAFGARGSDPVSLDRALDADRSRGWDSDGDGVADVDEIVQGTDPSGPALGRVAGPKHGCSVTGKRTPFDMASAAAIAGVLASMLARRRKRDRYCGPIDREVATDGATSSARARVHHKSPPHTKSGIA
jgi:hypothetical protein